MNEREQAKSGELTSFLHLTGWRPVVLALLAGTAAAVGLYLALGEPAQFVARYNVSVRDVADDDLTPQEIGSLAQGIVLDMQLPQTIAGVEAAEATRGLVEEEDYEIGIQRSPASTEIIDINVVSDTPENAQNVAVETAIIGLNTNLVGERATLSNKVDALQAELDVQEQAEAGLIEDAGGLRPDTAYLRASELYLARLDFIANPPLINEVDDDGNVVQVPAPEPETPTVEELLADVEELERIDREYQRVRARIDDLNGRLGDDRQSLREVNTAIVDLQDERTTPSVIQQIDTEEASRISSLLTGILLFAIPAALLTILTFVIFDLLFRRTDEVLIVADPIDAHGVLAAGSHPALPEASVAQLVVVDDEGNETIPVPDETLARIYDAEDDFVDDDDDIDDQNYEDEDDADGGEGEDGGDSDKGKGKGKSKESRWGRDAGSKAG